MLTFFDKHLKTRGVVSILRNGKLIGKIAKHGGRGTGWPTSWMVSVPGILAPGMGGWKARGSATFKTYREACAALLSKLDGGK